MKMKTIWWRREGPKLECKSDKNGVRLRISDLNPEVTMLWAMSRRECFQIGYELIKAAIWGGK